MLSIGGWDAPHPNTSFSGEEWWDAWHRWNSEIAVPSLGFDGFDGIDWDLEGNDNVASPYNEFTVACLELVGAMSAAARAHGFITSLVPAQSYFDVETSAFDRSLLHAYPDYHPDFAYHGWNAYAFLQSKFGPFDIVDVQLYETWSRASRAIQAAGTPAPEYLARLAHQLSAGWRVDFDNAPELDWPSQVVSVAPSTLVFGFSFGSLTGRSLYVPPEDVEAAFGRLSASAQPRGVMFWNMALDGGLVNGTDTTVNLAASFNSFLHTRPTACLASVQ